MSSATTDPLHALPHLVVTSANAAKQAGVLEAFAEFKMIQLFNMSSIAVDPGLLGGQPFGLQQTLDCARARINAVKKRGLVENMRTGLIVSAESGVVCVMKLSDTDSIDISCVVIEVIETGQQTFAFSQSRPFPLMKVQQMHALGHTGADVGHFCEKYYTGLSLPVSRQCQVQSATTMALAQITV